MKRLGQLASRLAKRTLIKAAQLSWWRCGRFMHGFPRDLLLHEGWAWLDFLRTLTKTPPARIRCH